MFRRTCPTASPAGGGGGGPGGGVVQSGAPLCMRGPAAAVLPCWDTLAPINMRWHRATVGRVGWGGGGVLRCCKGGHARPHPVVSHPKRVQTLRCSVIARIHRPDPGPAPAAAGCTPSERCSRRRRQQPTTAKTIAAAGLRRNERSGVQRSRQAGTHRGLIRSRCHPKRVQA